MRLASAIVDGRRTFGAVTDAGFHDLRGALGERFADLRQFLAAEALAQAARALAAGAPAVPLERITFLPPIPNPDARMFALGWSYQDHQLEMGKEPVAHPFLFAKLPQSLVGHEADLVRPTVSRRFDYEGEIVIVIGRPGRHVAPEAAASHIAGYAIAMDGSVRDWQQHSVTAGKNFDASSSYGPWIVTADGIADPSSLRLETRLNGQVMQQASFGTLAWTPAELVAYVSTFTRLEAGDAISTGTPGGVGHKRTPPVFLAAGDVLEIRVEGIGSLRNRVTDEETG